MLDRIKVTTPAGDETLKFWKLAGEEAVSHAFELSVTLLSTEARLDRQALLGHPITLTIPTGGLLAAPRHLNGKITAVNVHSADIHGERYAVYTLTMESDLWPLKRDRNQRIFQHQRVPDIINTILGEYGVQVDSKLTGNYREWEYCVQYQESSYAFISRLMELEGIYFFFRHEEGQHTLVLCDGPDAHQPFNGYEVIPYHATPSGGSSSEQGIGQWAIADRVMPGLYSIDDYDFRKPNAWLLHARQNPASPSPGQVDYYDWPGRFVENSHAETYARVRQEEWQANHRRIEATGTALGLVPGCSFTLVNPPFISDGGDYLILSARYALEENRYASGDDTPLHRIDFTVIPAETPYRSAQHTPWPRTHGPQTARVVGPQGESIWTDKYGRIKVKFHWDRLGKGDETSSCWVRVSSAWAGQGFGGVQIPRVGDEVVVDFINGDPDRPMVTGRVYNEASMPPWALPAAATMMGFMSRSKDGSSDNSSHLFFEDKAGSEMVQLHAEKDMNISVENDKTVTVDGSRTTTIQKEQSDEVFGNALFQFHGARTTVVDGDETFTGHSNRTETIDGNETISIKGNRIENVDGNEAITIHGERTESVDGNETVTIKGNENTTVEGYRSVNVTGYMDTHVKGLRVEQTDGNVTHITKGKYDQTVDGAMTMASLSSIKITSTANITLDAPHITLDTPNLETTNKEYVKMAWTSFGIYGISGSFAGFSLSINPISIGFTGLRVNNNPVEIHKDNGLKFRAAGCEWDNLGMAFHAAAVWAFV